MNSRLPIRIAQNRHARLEAFDDAYFEFLRASRISAIYLQNSPFDPMRTGNIGQFFHHFHLISLFDLSRSHRRTEYQDYVNEVCRRAAEFGIEVWLDCWEPRLPAHAQALIPPAWRGRGGWGWHGRKDIAFCWEIPEAVAFWKSMAWDAIAALPDLGGVIVSMMDNEASFCDSSCPVCKGRSLEAGICDVFSTFEGLASNRAEQGKPLKLAMYDWWLPRHLVQTMTGRLPAGSLVIGRSARGIVLTPPDKSWTGRISDISNIADGVAADFPQHCSNAIDRQLVPIDMVSWSRGMENFFLPAPPDPLFAIRKSRALAESGAGGWMDYDCGNFEPGSLTAAMREWDADPEAGEEELIGRTLHSIWGGTDARKAYDLYREARQWMPAGIPSEEVAGLDSRCCGLGYCLFGPFLLEDLRFHDTRHAFNFFAPYNLLTGETLPHFENALNHLVPLLAEAASFVRKLPAHTEAAKWERDVFEIYWRSFRALDNYVHLASAKWAHAEGRIDHLEFTGRVQAIASDELDNLDATERWNAARPGHLGNPCHRILGHMLECWPDANFSEDIFAPKRRSLEFLRDRYQPGEFVPGYAIMGTASDDGVL